MAKITSGFFKLGAICAFFDLGYIKVDWVIGNNTVAIYSLCPKPQ